MPWDPLLDQVEPYAPWESLAIHSGIRLIYWLERSIECTLMEETGGSVVTSETLWAIGEENSYSEICSLSIMRFSLSVNITDSLCIAASNISRWPLTNRSSSQWRHVPCTRLSELSLTAESISDQIVLSGSGYRGSSNTESHRGLSKSIVVLFNKIKTNNSKLGKGTVKD